MRNQTKFTEQPLVYFVKCGIGLFRTGKPGQNRPRLGIQEDLVLCVLVGAELLTGAEKGPQKPLAIPEDIVDIPAPVVVIFRPGKPFFIADMLKEQFQFVSRMGCLEEDKSTFRFPILIDCTNTIVPVAVEKVRNTVVTHILPCEI